MSEETLSQSIIKKANKTISIVDDLGRTIVLKKPRYSSYLDLIKAVGSELAKNEAYLQHVSLLATVVSIDGQPMPLKNLIDIDHLVKVIEESEDALPKISKAVVEAFTDHVNQEEHNEALKKL
jgi:hypothetical protein